MERWGPLGQWCCSYHRQERQLKRQKSVDVHSSSSAPSYLTSAQWSFLSLLVCLLLLEIVFEYSQHWKPCMLPCPRLNYYRNSWSVCLSFQAKGTPCGHRLPFHHSYIQCQDSDWCVRVLYVSPCVKCVLVLSCSPQWTRKWGSYFFHMKLLGFLI